MAELAVQVGPLTLRNPFLLASGIWGESGESLAGAWAAGAGGVITKSIGGEPRAGYPNPTIETYSEWGLLNAMGLPNPGIEEYPKEIALARAAGATVIGSVFGGNAEEFARLSARMAETGVVAIELNLSCPHAEGYGTEVGSEPADVEEIVRAVVREVKVPVIAKITPNTPDPAALASAAEKGGAAAVSAINTVRALAIDVSLHRPVPGTRTRGAEWAGDQTGRTRVRLADLRPGLHPHRRRGRDLDRRGRPRVPHGGRAGARGRHGRHPGGHWRLRATRAGTLSATRRTRVRVGLRRGGGRPPQPPLTRTAARFGTPRPSRYIAGKVVPPCAPSSK